MTSEEKQIAIFGKNIEVFSIGKNENGESDIITEIVNIKPIPVGDYAKATMYIDDTVEFIAFCTGKDKEWINSLLQESILELDAICSEINKGFFLFLIRQSGKMASLTDGITPEQLQKLIKFQNIKKVSQT